MGGRDRIIVAGLFVGAGTIAAALVGIALTVVLAPFAPVGELTASTQLVVSASFVAAGVVLDLGHSLTGRLAPLAVGRQVPREWGRLLPIRVVAVLYGVRMGVGPLTMLSTWTWWSVTLAATILGIGVAALVGAAFALVRLTVTVAASRLLDQQSGLAPLGARRRLGWTTLNTVALAAVGVALLAGCSGASPATEAAADTRPLTVVSLEDVVRPPTTAPPSRPTPTTAAPTTTESNPPVDVDTEIAAEIEVEPETMGDLLLDEIAGFVPIDDPSADRALDLSAAAAIQPDPTEETALLETRGFKAGWTRAFRSTANDVAIASVYEFEDAAEAEFYLEDGLITIGGYGGTFFDIAALPGVRGFLQADDPEVVSLGAAYHDGPRWYLLYFVGHPDTVTPDVLLPAVTSQVALTGE